MSKHLMELLSVNYIDFLLALGTIIVASVAIKEAVEKFCKMVGIEFSWIRANRENKECQNKIREDLDLLKEKQEALEELRKEDAESRDKFNKTIVDSITSLKNDIASLAEHIEKREAEKRFKKLRDDILNFANQLSSKTYISSELISHIYDEINEYEALHEKYNFKNNQAPASIAVIQTKYQEMLMNGQIK